MDCRANPSTHTIVHLTISPSTPVSTQPIRSSRYSAADCSTAPLTISVRTTGEYGAYTEFTTTRHLTFSGSLTRRVLLVRRLNGGYHAAWRCKALHLQEW